MKKINRKILSLPPYLSTSWKNISLLHMKEEGSISILVVTLQSGSTIEIPNLDAETIKEVFLAHSQFLEQATTESREPTPAASPQKGNIALSLGVPFPFNGIEGMENFSSFLQHNPAQANTPDLPPEVIEKIQAITKAMGLNLEQVTFPKGEPHCNCMYCQIARAIYNESDQIGSSEQDEGEEEVSSEDLAFRSWDIKKAGEKQYLVTNPLDQSEHYQVYLGSPIGCTCGQKNCEHIRVVLSS
ncbi:MAG: hypothetical protein AAF443_01130 [Chlamydiota bacterium]